MCLRKVSYMPRIATKDITVYKVVYKEYSEDFKYKTVCRNSPIKLGTCYKGIFQSKGSVIRSIFSKYINDGYIHSFSTIEDSSYLLYSTRYHYPYKRVCILRAIIPKGTIYYKGAGGDLASRKLKYIEEIRNC